MSVTQKIAEVCQGLKSLVVGLGVTGKTFCRPAVTVLYPWREVDNLASFHGHVELVGKDDDPAVPRCVACGGCAKACPSQCLTILCPVPAKEGEAEGEPAKLGPAPQKGAKTPARVILDFSLCSLCGQCVRACPVDSLKFSNDPYLVATSREALRLDLVARLRRQAGQDATGA